MFKVPRKEDIINKIVNVPGDDPTGRIKKFIDDAYRPLKIIGVGQTGVGKSELIKSIFKEKDEDIKNIDSGIQNIITDNKQSATKDFTTVTITGKNSFQVQITDSVGMGQSEETEETTIQEWIKEIPNHDILYWVLDITNRDIAQTSKNMRRVLNETKYNNKMVLVLNKVDQFVLTEEERNRGLIGWDEEYNLPSRALEEVIYKRTDDIIEKFSKIGLRRERIIACSALKRWNTGSVFDKFIEILPEDERIKLDSVRKIKSFLDGADPDIAKRYRK
jgi:predicted GTPase